MIHVNHCGNNFQAERKQDSTESNSSTSESVPVWIMKESSMLFYPTFCLWYGFLSRDKDVVGEIIIHSELFFKVVCVSFITLVILLNFSCITPTCVHEFKGLQPISLLYVCPAWWELGQFLKREKDTKYDLGCLGSSPLDKDLLCKRTRWLEP